MAGDAAISAGDRVWPRRGSVTEAGSTTSPRHGRQDETELRGRVLGPRRGRDQRDRLADELMPADQPVEQVLERAREAPGIFGRRDHERIGRLDLPPQIANGGRKVRAVEVGVEGRQLRQAAIGDDLDPHGCDQRERVECGRVGGGLPQAAREREKPHARTVRLAGTARR